MMEALLTVRKGRLSISKEVISGEMDIKSDGSERTITAEIAA